MPRPKAKPQTIQDIAGEFWARVDKTTIPDGCWNWQGKPSGPGYGQLTRRGISPIPLYTHRITWELTNGPIPEGKHVLHSCDNRMCCRPDHLFLGDQTANNADRHAKGRTASGDKNGARTHPDRNPFVRDGGSGLRRGEHPMAKLNNNQIHELMTKWKTGKFTKTSLAGQYGISVAQACRIIERES